MGLRLLGAAWLGLVVWAGLAGVGPASAAGTCADQVRHGTPESLAPAESFSAPVCHTAGDENAFLVRYDRARNAPIWAAYHLSRNDVHRIEALDLPRRGSFRQDDAIETDGWEAPTTDDYVGIGQMGYQRGHLVPAESLAWSEAAMRASFVTSNLMIQDGGMNGGDWASLESYVRTWACIYGDVYVVTGPVYGPDAPASFQREDGPVIAIPSQVYKVVYTPAAGGRAIGFLFDNVDYDTERVPANSIKAIDRIESLAGVDLLPELTSGRATELESGAADVAHWPMEARACKQVDRAARAN